MKTQNILSFILFSIIMLWGNISLAATSKPTVTITVAQSPIVYGGTGTISWSSTNATSCTASGGWTGAKPTSGTYITPSLTKSTTYSISCTGNGGSKSASVTESVKSASISPPIVNLSASITAAPYQGSATLTWTTLNTSSVATPCTASGGWSGAKAASGSVTLASLSNTATYTLTCTGQGGSTSSSVIITVAPPPPPVLTLTANSTSIAYGATALLTWSATNATSCLASGGWTGSEAVSGTYATPALTTATAYTLTCTGASGTVAQTVNIIVAASPAPTVTLTASPASVAAGATSVLTWSSTNTTSCLASGSWAGAQALSGTYTTLALNSSTTYTLTCTGLDNVTTIAQSASVTVNPSSSPTLTFSANPASIAMGSTAALTWSSTNTTTCVGAGGWNGSQALSGTFTTPALNSTTIYTLTCTGSDGSTVTQNATLTVTSSVVNAGSKMGVNISYINDWGDRQHTFIDVMKQARGFASLNCPWDPVACPVPLDANGWPTTDSGVFFLTPPSDPLGRPLTTTYPSMFGTYKVSFTGQATVRPYNYGVVQNVVYNPSTNTTTADLIIRPTDGYVALTFSNTTNGIQNLQVLRPGYALGTNQVFTSEFLNALAPFSTIRTMEALATNSNPVTSWAARTLASAPTQSSSTGVAWEYVIQLANATGKDIWINIPDQVNLDDPTANNYVVQLATLIKNTLNPGIHVYVEYSNELWNGMFTQTHTNTTAAVADVNSGADPSLNFDNINNQWYWGYRRAAHQTLKISQLFAGVFGQSAINTTIRPVYMSQYVQPFLTEDTLMYLNANFGAPSQYLYGIGGAPYFSPQTAYTDMDGLFAALQTGLNSILPGFSGLPAYTGGLAYSGIQFKNIANYYGLKTLMYEGGPDLTVNNTNQALVQSAESDIRINQVVQAELADAIGCGNDLFMYYKLAAPTSDPFGAYEDLTLPTPKSMALNSMAATPLSAYNVCTATMTNQLYIQ